MPDGLRIYDDFIWILKFLEDFKGTFEGTEAHKSSLFLDLRIDAYEGEILMVSVGRSIQRSTYGPTETNKKSLEIVVTLLEDSYFKVESAEQKISRLAEDLLQAGSPWIEGEPLPKY